MKNALRNLAALVLLPILGGQSRADYIFTTIDVPGAGGTSITGINNSGQMSGTYTDPRSGTAHGFLLSGGVFTPIDAPGATSTSLSGINASGQIVGFTDTYSFLLSRGVFTTIDAPGATGTIAYGINDAGQIVGAY